MEFTFAAKSNTYIRLAIAVVTVANGERATNLLWISMGDVAKGAPQPDLWAFCFLQGPAA